MNIPLLIGAVAAGTLVLGAAGAYGGARTLFNRVIPRQDGVKVDMNEMADMQQWEEYKKIILPNKEWLLAQPLEKVSIKARDGITLRAHYLPAAQPSDRLVIGLHGYTSSGLGEFSTHARFYHELGFDCLIVDHRAHGESEGDYVGFGILDRHDCMSWISYLEKRFGGSKRILLHGTSMGASTALMVSGFRELPDSVKGIVSDCAFTSPFDVFSHVLKRDYHMSPFPIMQINDAMCRKKAGYGFKDYSTLTAMEHNRLPVLFIHGANDTFVPTWMTQKNYEACKAPKKMIMVENAGHGASCYENNALYQKEVAEFVESHIPAADKKEA